MAGFVEYVYSEAIGTHCGEAMYDCSASSSRLRNVVQLCKEIQHAITRSIICLRADRRRNGSTVRRALVAVLVRGYHFALDQRFNIGGGNNESQRT